MEGLKILGIFIYTSFLVINILLIPTVFLEISSTIGISEIGLLILGIYVICVSIFFIIHYTFIRKQHQFHSLKFIFTCFYCVYNYLSIYFSISFAAVACVSASTSGITICVFAAILIFSCNVCKIGQLFIPALSICIKLQEMLKCVCFSLHWWMNKDEYKALKKFMFMNFVFSNLPVAIMAIAYRQSHPDEQTALLYVVIILNLLPIVFFAWRVIMRLKNKTLALQEEALTMCIVEIVVVMVIPLFFYRNLNEGISQISHFIYAGFLVLFAFLGIKSYKKAVSTPNFNKRDFFIAMFDVYAQKISNYLSYCIAIISVKSETYLGIGITIFVLF